MSEKPATYLLPVARKKRMGLVSLVHYQSGKLKNALKALDLNRPPEELQKEVRSLQVNTLLMEVMLQKLSTKPPEPEPEFTFNEMVVLYIDAQDFLRQLSGPDGARLVRELMSKHFETDNDATDTRHFMQFTHALQRDILLEFVNGCNQLFAENPEWQKMRVDIENVFNNL